MIRFGRETDRQAIRELFDLCFPDESGFNAYFFQHIFQPARTLLAEQEGKLCAMLQMLLYRLAWNGEEGEATYIYGACTHPEHRRQHWMARLLETSFKTDQEQRRIASLLIPQEAWLFDFYRPFGYLPSFSLKREVLLRDGSANEDVQKLEDFSQAKLLYQQAMAAVPCHLVRSEKNWQAQFAMFQALGVGAFGLYEADRLLAYAFVWQEADGLFAQELIGIDSQCAERLGRSLLRQFGSEKLTYCTVGGTHPFGCLKLYRADSPTHGYINLMFN